MGKRKDKFVSGFARKIMGTADVKRIAGQKSVEGVTELKDIPYMDDGTKEHLLDIYFPEGGMGPYPVLIDIHGGGWMYGYKENNRNYGMTIAKYGFVFINLNYRLVPDVRVPEQVQDLFAAYQWIWENLDNYPADREHIYLTGDSAGGHLTLLSAEIAKNKELRKLYQVADLPFQFNAIAAVSPAVNLSAGFVSRMIDVLLGPDHKTSPYRDKISFPDVFDPEDYPPTYVITSNGDMVRDHGREVAALLKEKNVPHKFTDWEDKKVHIFAVMFPYDEDSVKAIEEMIAFLKQY